MTYLSENRFLADLYLTKNTIFAGDDNTECGPSTVIMAVPP